MTLEDYQTRLALAQGEIDKLREENNKFRLLLLTQEMEPNSIYIAQQKQTWAAMPLDKAMAFLELFETHTKIFAEIVHSQMNSKQIKEYVTEREERKKAAAKEYRDAKSPEKKAQVAAAQGYSKAARSLAKTLKITYDAAEKMLEGMKK